jgi:hypothetical protein
MLRTPHTPRLFTRPATLLALFAGVAAANHARAQGVLSMWEGPWGGDFNSAFNWGNNRVPDAPGEFFVIDAGSAVMSANALVDKFGLINGSYLTISNSLFLGVLSRPAGGQDTHTGIFGGGIITMNAAQYGTYLYIAGGQPGDFAIHGDSGLGNSRIIMSDSPNNIIYTNTAGLVLINEGVIEGAGQVGYNALAIQNSHLAGGPRALILANRPNNALVIDPPNATPFRNIDSILRADGGVLILRGGTFINEQGAFIEIGGSFPNSAVHLDGARVQGGLLASPPGWSFLAYNNAALADLNLTGRLRVLNSHVLNLEGDILLGSAASLELEAVQYGTYFNVTAPSASFSGVGEVVLSNSPNNVIYTSTAGHTLTNNTLGGIRGAGQIGYNSLFVTNNSTITAQGSSGLVIDPPASGFDNNGTLRAAANSTLTLLNGTIDNAGGEIVADPDGYGSLNGVRVAGGLVRTFGTGTIGAINSSTIAGVTLTSGSNLRVVNGHYLFSEGVHTFDGTLSLDAVQYGTFLNAAAHTTLNGSGQVVLSNSPNNVFYTGVAGNSLTNNLTGGIRGSGQIGYNSLFVINNTAITAEGTAGLIIDAPASGFDNNGTLRAASGATLTLLNGSFDNTGGQLLVEDTGIGYLNGARVSNGSLRSLGAGFIGAYNSSTIANVTVTPGSNLRVLNGHYLFSEGILTIQGTLSLDAAQYGTFLNINTPTVTLTGGGEVVLSDSPNNVFYTGVGGHRLLNQNTTIRGAGQLGYNSLAITNRGVIRTDATNTLVLDPPAGSDAFLNDTGGLVHATTGNIILQGGVFRNLGTLRIDPARLFLDNADPFTQEAGLVRVDGELEVVANSYLLQGGSLSGTGRVDANVAHSGGVIAPGNSAGILTIEGTLTQQPAAFLDIEIGGPTPGTEHDRLVVTSTAALGGTLRLSFLGGIPQNTPLTILTAASRTGTFASVQAPGGVTAVVDYLPTSVVVTLTCAGRADFNGDGFIDFFDYDDFVLCYEGGGCPPGSNPDINQDGFVDFFDYDDFVVAFEAGC